MIKAYGLNFFDRYKLRDPEYVKEKTEAYFNAICTRRDAVDFNGEVVFDECGEAMKEDYFITPPTIAGYALYLGVTKETLDNYRFYKGENIPDRNTLIDQKKEVLESIKTKRDGLSFTNRKPTESYVEELEDAIKLREVIDIITWGYSIIEEYNSIRLYDGGHKGALVVLKNSFGYTDKKEVEVTANKKLEDFMKE